MTQNIVIVGAGGFGREVLDVVEAVNGDAESAGEPKLWRFLGFLDDDKPDTHGRGDIIGPVKRLNEWHAAYVIGIGDPSVRRQLDKTTDRRAAVLVHPAATIGADVTLGPGTVVTAGVRVTNHIWIGRHVHLNLNATVGHEAILHDYVTVNPGATISGEVTLEEGVTIGTGAAVNQQRKVGPWSTIGSGAAVVKDIPAGVVATGVPAKVR